MLHTVANPRGLTRAGAAATPRAPAPAAASRRPLLASRPALWIARSRAGDDSDEMGRDNFEAAADKPQGETLYTETGIKEGKVEGSPVVVGTEYGQEAEQRSAGGGDPSSAREGQEEDRSSAGHSSSSTLNDSLVSTPAPQGASDQAARENLQTSMPAGAADSEQEPQGGRFGEESSAPNHPYDPRPRERGHGIPPHKGADNTVPGPKSAGS